MCPMSMNEEIEADTGVCLRLGFRVKTRIVVRFSVLVEVVCVIAVCFCKWSQ